MDPIVKPSSGHMLKSNESCRRGDRRPLNPAQPVTADRGSRCGAVWAGKLVYQRHKWCNGGIRMLYWALVFFIISLIAAIFGFTGIATATAGVAKILFFIFLVLFILSLLFGYRRRPPA
jgi:uncharacterized membrane protein YtjA (UPF0391 family)